MTTTTPIIIGICGSAGAGKDTLGNILCNEYGFVKASFAAPLKDMASTLFGWDRTLLEGDTEVSRNWREKPDEEWCELLNRADFTPRKALQEMGLKMRDSFHVDIFVKSLQRRCKGKKVVITDCRFSNEIEAIKKIGGIVIEIQRGPCPAWVSHIENGRENHPSVPHRSEWEWRRTKKDAIIQNNGSIDELGEHLKKIPQISPLLL